MAKYNTQEIKVDTKSGPVTYVFASKGRWPFTMEEMTAYITEHGGAIITLPTQHAEELEEETYSSKLIPDSKERVRMFMEDLKRGPNFCAAKYGVSYQAISEEAERLFPSLNIANLWGANERTA